MRSTSNNGYSYLWQPALSREDRLQNEITKKEIELLELKAEYLRTQLK